MKLRVQARRRDEGDICNIITFEKSSITQALDERRLSLIIDEHGTIFQVGGSAPALFGFDPGNLIGKPIGSAVDVFKPGGERWREESAAGAGGAGWGSKGAFALIPSHALTMAVTMADSNHHHSPSYPILLGSQSSRLLVRCSCVTECRCGRAHGRDVHAGERAGRHCGADKAVSGSTLVWSHVLIGLDLPTPEIPHLLGMQPLPVQALTVLARMAVLVAWL